LEAIENVMEKRCSLGLFSFAIFFAFDPAFAAQIEAVTENGKPSVRKSSGDRPFRVDSTAVAARQRLHLLGLRNCILGKGGS
jgi:hypothetical protein